MAKSIAIVGGGITGLATAFYLERNCDANITLFEASPRLGGKIETFTDGDLLIEGSADSLFTRKPAAIHLIRELGLQDEILEPKNRGFSMLIEGKLHPVPANLLAFGRISAEILDSVEFLSPSGKDRILAERTTPPAAIEDESIASFFTRRYGAEYSQKIAEPLLAGTHSGLPEKLSIAALYPNLLKMEREAGSLSAGMDGLPQSLDTSTFVTLKNGMDRLPDAISKTLNRTEIKYKAAERLERNGIDNQPFDEIVLAVPAHYAASLLQNLNPELALELEQFKTASAAVVTLGFSNADLSNTLEGTGFLVPYTEQSLISGATWSSNKWEGRAPEGESLIRVFLGREGVLDINNQSDQALIRIASEAMANLLNNSTPPTYSRVRRWPHSLPQYEVGHLKRLEAITQRLTNIGAIHLAGQSYGGVGIPDCIAQAKQVALKIAQS